MSATSPVDPADDEDTKRVDPEETYGDPEDEFTAYMEPDDAFGFGINKLGDDKAQVVVFFGEGDDRAAIYSGSPFHLDWFDRKEERGAIANVIEESSRLGMADGEKVASAFKDACMELTDEDVEAQKARESLSPKAQAIVDLTSGVTERVEGETKRYTVTFSAGPMTQDLTIDGAQLTQPAPPKPLVTMLVDWFHEEFDDGGFDAVDGDSWKEIRKVWRADAEPAAGDSTGRLELRMNATLEHLANTTESFDSPEALGDTLVTDDGVYYEADTTERSVDHDGPVGFVTAQMFADAIIESGGRDEDVPRIATRLHDEGHLYANTGGDLVWQARFGDERPRVRAFNPDSIGAEEPADYEARASDEDGSTRRI